MEEDISRKHKVELCRKLVSELATELRSIRYSAKLILKRKDMMDSIDDDIRHLHKYAWNRLDRQPLDEYWTENKNWEELSRNVGIFAEMKCFKYEDNENYYGVCSNDIKNVKSKCKELIAIFSRYRCSD